MMLYTLPAKNRGITLLELMIVVTVIAILATIAFPSYGAYVQKNRLTVAKAMLNSARQEIQTTYLRTGQYPVAIGANESPNTNGDYNRYFTVSIDANDGDPELVTTPTDGNGYDGFASMNIHTGAMTYTCVKYTGACESMKNTDKKS